MIDDAPLQIRSLKLFLAVVREGSLRKAAVRLDLSQPTLSYQITSLERAVGHRLLLRTRRGVLLTEAGRALLPHAEALVRGAGEAMKEVHEIATGASGIIRVAAAPSAAAGIVSQAFREFRRARPGVALGLREAFSDAAIRMLEDGRVDIAVVRGPLAGADLEVVVEVHEPLVLIVSPDHRLASRNDGVDLSELSDEAFVLDRPDSHTALHAAVSHACSTAGFLPNVACEGAELLTVGRLVAYGVGIALIPRSMADLIRDVHRRSVNPPTPRSSIAVVVGRPRRLNPASEGFLTALCAVASRVIGREEARPAEPVAGNSRLRHYRKSDHAG